MRVDFGRANRFKDFHTKVCNKSGKNGSRILRKLKVLPFRFLLLDSDNRRDDCPTVREITELEEINYLIDRELSDFMSFACF
jgi:hypothetical protein